MIPWPGKAHVQSVPCMSPPLNKKKGPFEAPSLKDKLHFNNPRPQSIDKRLCSGMDGAKEMAGILPTGVLLEVWLGGGGDMVLLSTARIVV